MQTDLDGFSVRLDRFNVQQMCIEAANPATVQVWQGGYKD